MAHIGRPHAVEGRVAEMAYGGKVAAEYVWLGGAKDSYFSAFDMRSK